ncbi:sodium:solute symporter family protein [Terrisporobacter vanillatitrophus]
MNIPLIIVILYVIMLLGISVVVSRKSKKDGGDDFLLYKNKNSTMITAVTIAGVAIGGASTIGIAENAFSVGLSAGWYNVAWAFGAIIASFTIVKKLRKSGFSTVTKLIQSVYDEKAGVMMTVAMIIIQCTIIALQYIAGGSILSSLLPDVFDMKTATFFSFLIFMLVGFVGGMGSASISNILNISLIYIGVITSAVLVLFNQGGWEAAKIMAASTPDVPYMSLTSGMGIPAIIAWMIVMCGNTNSVQGVIQIGLTSKDDKSAVNGFRIGALLMIPIGFICAMLGIASKALIPNVEATQALPMIIMSLPPVMAGLTLSALWAADMSTACSMLIGCSTTVSHDVFFKTKAGNKLKDKSFMINKIIILVVGILTYILSSQLGTILSSMKVCLSMAIGTSIIVVAGLWFPKFSSKNAGFFTILSSVFAAGGWLVLPALHDIFKDIGYWMIVVSGITFIVISLVEKNKVTANDEENVMDNLNLARNK